MKYSKFHALGWNYCPKTSYWNCGVNAGRWKVNANFTGGLIFYEEAAAGG